MVRTSEGARSLMCMYVALSPEAILVALIGVEVFTKFTVSYVCTYVCAKYSQ